MILQVHLLMNANRRSKFRNRFWNMWPLETESASWRLGRLFTKSLYWWNAQKLSSPKWPLRASKISEAWGFISQLNEQNVVSPSPHSQPRERTSSSCLCKVSHEDVSPFLPALLSLEAELTSALLRNPLAKTENPGRKVSGGCSRWREGKTMCSFWATLNSQWDIRPLGKYFCHNSEEKPRWKARIRAQGHWQMDGIKGVGMNEGWGEFTG